ncbi:hypothetical protein [Crinalium epipsammum]|nr:hypothetical protein [Crinalium epipsammum]
MTEEEILNTLSEKAKYCALYIKGNPSFVSNFLVESNALKKFGLMKDGEWEELEKELQRISRRAEINVPKSRTLFEYDPLWGWKYEPVL